MPNKRATRELLLEASIRCIEKYGLENVTTRRIALAAGTNLASINYHFRSKDELVSETLSLTIDHMLQDVLYTLADQNRPFELTLRDVFRYLLEGSSRFPGLSRAHLTQAVIDRQKDSVGARAMRKVFKALLKRALRQYPRRDGEELRVCLAQVMYSIMFTVLAPDFLGALSRGRSSRAKQAKGLADSYADLFLRGIQA